MNPEKTAVPTQNHLSRSISRFLPFGDYRTTPGTTDHSSKTIFTDYKHNDYINLIYGIARYYVPSIGRFASADVIIPTPKNPQSFNRYSYVLNNPIRLTDPSGHCAQDDSDCWDIADQLYTQYGWTIDGVWSLGEVTRMLEAAQMLEAWVESILLQTLTPQRVDAKGIMRTLFGGATIAHPASLDPLSWDFDINIGPLNFQSDGFHHVFGMTIYLLDGFSANTLVHEMFHILDNKFGSTTLGGSAAWGGGPADDMAQAAGQDISRCLYRSRCSNYGQTPGAEKPPGDAGSYAWNGPSEDFAETGELLVTGSGNSVGSRRTEWFTNFIALQVSTPEFSGSPYTYWQRTSEPKYRHLGSEYFE